MWDNYDKAAQPSRLFLGKILISEAKRKEDEVRSGGTVFFGKNIGTITKSGRSRQLYLSDLRNETRYHWVQQGEMLRWDKLYKKIR